MPRHRNDVIAAAALLLLAGCGGDNAVVSDGNTGPVAAKAVADVDAAMADAQQAPPANARRAAP